MDGPLSPFSCLSRYSRYFSRIGQPDQSGHRNFPGHISNALSPDLLIASNICYIYLNIRQWTLWPNKWNFWPQDMYLDETGLNLKIMAIILGKSAFPCLCTPGARGYAHFLMEEFAKILRIFESEANCDFFDGLRSLGQ